MEEKCVFAKFLDEKGLTCEQAAEMTGVSYGLVYYLYRGGETGRTLPSIALTIGTTLGMTQEQVKTIGKSLLKRNWRASRKKGETLPNHVIPLPKDGGIELNDQWYKHLGESKYRHKEDGPGPKHSPMQCNPSSLQMFPMPFAR